MIGDPSVHRDEEEERIGHGDSLDTFFQISRFNLCCFLKVEMVVEMLLFNPTRSVQASDQLEGWCRCLSLIYSLF